MTGGEPEWVDRTVWWQVYPLGFLGAERESGPDAAATSRLDRLVPWLDYAAELGATGLALGPIFASGSHGYDTIDHRRIDPRLGDDAAFDRLIAAAHDRGLRVMLDGVFNHVGRGFPAFRQAIAAGPGSTQTSWFRLSWPAGGAPGAEPDYACFEGHRQLVTLNHDEPAVAAYIHDVMDGWLRRGADGWRLDAAYAVPRRFWAALLPRLRAAHPEAYIVGEVIHGEYAAIVRETGMHSLTQYELWKAIWSALNDRNLFELAWALDRHNGFLDGFVPLTFVGNHDVTRLASQLKDIRHLPHALAVLFACGGTPSIYAGDEQAFRGLKEHRAGGDDAIRPAFPASPSDLLPDGWSTYRIHQDLIRVRREHPWLHRARATRIHLTNEQTTLELKAEGGRALLALNLADEASALPAPFARDLAAGDGSLAEPGGPAARVRLPAHGWAILA